MKRFIGVVAVLILVLSAGAALGSERERHESREYGHGEYQHPEKHGSRIYGTIRQIPEGLIGVWDVNGREVTVTNETRIKEKHGKPEVGAYVEVKGSLSGKTVIAREVEVKRAKQ